jgi:2-dehydropantoate 2-reductase
MKIAVMGTGGVGGYYGGLLARQGHAVTFLARGAHLEALRKNGLQVISIHGDFQISPARATDNPAEIGPVDLFLFCTKTHATEQAAREAQPLVGKATTVLSLQNGIDAAERIGAVLGTEHMLGGATWISAAIESPGVIKQVSQFRRVVIGELDGKATPRAEAVHKAFLETGVTAELSENILKILWTKFVFIAAAGGLGSLTRLPLGDIRAVPETRRLMAALMGEVEALAWAGHVDLEADVVAQSLAFVDAAAAQIKPSMQLDVEAGRRSELEALIGVIGRRGRALGVPTPVADFVYAALLPGDLKARGTPAQEVPARYDRPPG